MNFVRAGSLIGLLAAAACAPAQPAADSTDVQVMDTVKAAPLAGELDSLRRVDSARAADAAAAAGAKAAAAGRTRAATGSTGGTGASGTAAPTRPAAAADTARSTIIGRDSVIVRPRRFPRTDTQSNRLTS